MTETREAGRLATARLLPWVAVLYAASGLPYGLAAKAWPVYLRQAGVSLTEIGLLSLLFLPYSLKPLWAPWVDRFGDRRRWVAAAGLAGAAALLALPGVDPRTAGITLWAVLLAYTAASATQDLAVDGYAVDLVSGGDRSRDSGPVNGVRVAAYRVALIASGGLALLAVDRFGWDALWRAAAVAMVFLAGCALLAPRIPREAPSTLFDRDLLRWLLARERMPALALVLLYKLPDGALLRMVEPFWVDRGYSAAQIGLVATSLGTTLTIVGALAGGWWVHRRGLRAALLQLGVLQVASNGGYALVAAFDLGTGWLYAASAVESLTQGLATAAFLALLTALCSGRRGATQFAVLTAVYAVSRDLVGSASGWVAQDLGYATFFTASALLGLPALLLIQKAVPPSAPTRT